MLSAQFVQDVMPRVIACVLEEMALLIISQLLHPSLSPYMSQMLKEILNLGNMSDLPGANTSGVLNIEGCLHALQSPKAGGHR